ncbi:MAG: dephospho-CoA kinase [Endomicrobiales bacterium]|nr:dephospho-CoA kinase [Endomicrobiales bacterium]
MNCNNKKQFSKNIVLGLSGGLACGKSTAAKYFVKNGAKLIDADLIAKEILDVSGEGYKKVIKYLGVEVLNKDRSINREILLKRVARNKKDLNALNNITHPLILSQISKIIKKFIKSGAKLIVVDAPLLFESGLNKKVDFTVVVSSKLIKRIERICESNKMSISVFNKLRRVQMPLKEKCKLADFIILNNESLSYLENQVKNITKLLLNRYAK